MKRQDGKKLIPEHCLLQFQRQRCAVELLHRIFGEGGVQRPWLTPINPDNVAQVRTHPSTGLVQFMSAPGRTVKSNDPRTKVIGEIDIEFFGDDTPSQATVYVPNVMDFIKPTSRNLYRDAIRAGEVVKSIDTNIVGFSDLEEDALDTLPYLMETRRDRNMDQRQRYGNAEQLAGGKVKRNTYGGGK